MPFGVKPNVVGQPLGRKLRIARIPADTIPVNTDPFLDAYTVSEGAVLYRAIFKTDAATVRVKVVIDGVEITPGTDGFILNKLNTANLGLNTEAIAGIFDFTEYKTNCYLWQPPEPIRCRTSAILQLRSSNASTKQLTDGFFVYRKIA